MASAASGPKLLGSVPHCRTRSWLAFEVQAILAELALANSSMGFSTCVDWLVVGVAGVWAKAKLAQNTRTAAIFKRFFIRSSPPKVLRQWLNESEAFKRAEVVLPDRRNRRNRRNRK